MNHRIETSIPQESKHIPSEKWLDKVYFRQLNQSDLAALEWGGEYLHFRRLFREVYQNTKSGKAIMWGAALDGVGLIGQAFVQLNSARKELAGGSQRAYIHAFRVKSPYRGAGLGSRLLRVVESDLVQRGYQWITLNVAKDNPRARRFYERHGFRIVAVEAGRWSYLDHEGRLRKVNEPSWRMVKPITEMLTES